MSQPESDSADLRPDVPDTGGPRTDFMTGLRALAANDISLGPSSYAKSKKMLEVKICKIEGFCVDCLTVYFTPSVQSSQTSDTH